MNYYIKCAFIFIDTVLESHYLTFRNICLTPLSLALDLLKVGLNNFAIKKYNMPTKSFSLIII